MTDIERKYRRGKQEESVLCIHTYNIKPGFNKPPGLYLIPPVTSRKYSGCTRGQNALIRINSNPFNQSFVPVREKQAIFAHEIGSSVKLWPLGFIRFFLLSPIFRKIKMNIKIKKIKKIKI